MDKSKYSEKWQERFEFFENNGSPASKKNREALRNLPFLKQIKINMNFFAVFFNFIYFIILGLWKKGLTLLGFIFAIIFILGIIDSIFSLELSDNFYNAIGVAFAFLYGLSANYAYYLKEIKGDDSWNPFKGIFFDEK
ncbi:DUF2628 domain-containing protein [Xenorhabdus cabanillasii]|uniref:Uncharacterized protein DUF2628 n=2 Tax=Xenorhabdus cabanillasii TaxID=351673 RepID=A0A3D9UNM1_9GAMM|nr:DUF2628 domain-containing protein [Xenorhabdus cabanillasii]PHM76142.1 hypothetical protein Xcab_03346 [Xenorhabdus cabanillasii JM26]REF26301.1 uncharacterized protein DUF2628 [Xenorhabdus cabanillasii]CDL79711.1 conserved membrane hypothetical protein [Xenorhabdus cabanillasii JM26]